MLSEHEGAALVRLERFTNGMRTDRRTDLQSVRPNRTDCKSVLRRWCSIRLRTALIGAALVRDGALFHDMPVRYNKVKLPWTYSMVVKQGPSRVSLMSRAGRFVK